MVTWSEIVEDAVITASEIRKYIEENGVQAAKAAVANSPARLTDRARSILGATRGINTQKALRRVLGFSAAAAATLAAFAEDPWGFISDLLAERLLIPIGLSFYWAGQQFLNFISILIYGGNFEIGLGGGYIGLLDLPFLISGPIADVTFGLFTFVAELLIDLNASIAQPFTQIGIAAPAATGVFWFVEISAIVYFGWIIARSVDVPLINPTGMFLAVTRPFRNIIDRWFR